MIDVAETADALHESANQLYWQGAEGVDRLAVRLGMSRHALYGSIRPAPAGADCGACGEEMVFANRARRARGQAHCPGCGTDAVVSVRAIELLPADAAPPPPLPRPRRRSLVRRMLRLYLRDLRRVQPQRAALIGGAAAAGVAAALVGAEVVRNLDRL